MAEIINVEEARAYARERWPSPVVRRPLEALLDDCPRVEAEPVQHGRWIRLDDTFTNWKCSLCGVKYNGITWPYCSHCGAKMDGGAE